MARLEFRDLDAVFEDVDGALQVTQRGKTYRARKWRLTPGLEHTIQAAVRYGYTAFWVNGHPSDPYFLGKPKFQLGSHHITFARSSNEKWVFVADKPPDSHEVCFTKGLRDFLQEIDVQHEWEHSGGHNLRIPLGKLEYVLERLKPERIANLHVRSAGGAYLGAGINVGLANEDQLHAEIICKFGGKLGAMGFVLESKARTGVKSVPDLLLDARSAGFFVIELKFSHTGLVEHDQLLKYLRSPGVAQRCGDRMPHGVLIGRDFSPELINAAESSAGAVSLYSFSHVGSHIGFRHIAGAKTLKAAVPMLFEFQPPEPTGRSFAVSGIPDGGGGDQTDEYPAD